MDNRDSKRVRGLVPLLLMALGASLASSCGSEGPSQSNITTPPNATTAACINNGGGSWTAASAAATDVTDCITAASPGDTIAVPAGTVIWSAEVTITKTLTLQGNGIDSTIIRQHGFDINTGVNDYRITGFTFDGNWSTNWLISHAQSRTGNKRFRIDHNKFKNKAYSISGTIGFHGYSYGLIDHNTFNDVLDETLSFGGDGAAASARSPIFGGYENGTIFVEDNTFALTVACKNHYAPDPNGAAENIFDGNSGPRIVFRYNTVSDHTNCRWTGAALEAHGFESEYSTVGDARAVYAVEIYNNTFISNYPSFTAAMKFRGMEGGAAIYNNTFTGSGGSFNTLLKIHNLRSHITDDTESLSVGNIHAAGYTQFAHERQAGEEALICEHCTSHTGLVFGQVNNTYIWGNTGAGPVVVESVDYVPTDVMLNTHYFLSAMLGYTAYKYPHPLTGGSAP